MKLNLKVWFYDPLFDRFPLHLDTLLIIQYPGMKINLLSKIFQVLLQNMKLKLKQSCLVTIRRFLYKFEIAIFSSFRSIFFTLEWVSNPRWTLYYKASVTVKLIDWKCDKKWDCLGPINVSLSQVGTNPYHLYK